MAISYDNSDARRVLNGSSFSYTSAVGSHMFVLTETGVTGITYGGVSLGKIIDFTPSIHDGNQQEVLIWELVAPASGANNFSITAGALAYAFGVITFKDLKSTQPDAENDSFSNNGVNNTQVGSWSGTVTTTVDNCWSVMFIVGGNNSPRTFTAGASTTLRATTGSLDTRSIGILDSNGPISPAGGNTLTANWSSGTGFVSAVVLSVAPNPSFTPQLMIL